MYKRALEIDGGHVEANSNYASSYSYLVPTVSVDTTTICQVQLRDAPDLGAQGLPEGDRASVQGLSSTKVENTF